MRKIVFWTHLVCGVASGLVILMMSVTGVILTYERQMLAWGDRDVADHAVDSTSPKPLEHLLDNVRAAYPDFNASSVSITADDDARVAVSAGRAGSLYVDRRSGAVLGEGSPRLRAFFGAITGWHRWFNVTGEARSAARAITGASNLMFLFLVLSGVYLWLPKVWRWAAFRTRLFFNRRATTSKARDFNWHHVFGFWSAIPLAIVVATAVVFSYGWADELVYRAFGEERPRRGVGPPAAVSTSTASAGSRLPLDALLDIAVASSPEWRSITLQIPNAEETAARLTIDTGNGGQPQLRSTLRVDIYSGKTEPLRPFSEETPGRRARLYIRYLHTGEALGIVGQTIAGIVSLTSIVMVWTGLALAWRRLIQPLFTNRAGRRGDGG